MPKFFQADNASSKSGQYWAGSFSVWKIKEKNNHRSCYENNLKEQSCGKKAAVFAYAKITPPPLPKKKKHFGKQITVFQVFFPILPYFRWIRSLGCLHSIRANCSYFQHCITMLHVVDSVYVDVWSTILQAHAFLIAQQRHFNNRYDQTWKAHYQSVL